MEDFISQSDGFILVSFGSEARIGNAPKELRDAFFNAFRNTKSKFIWKWEGPRPEDMPPNVFTTSWIPQQSVLGKQKNDQKRAGVYRSNTWSQHVSYLSAHPKIKMFITHGGLLSIQEALWHKVPMISFPIFAGKHS